ncbi:MAG: archaetidylserine decarboxylase [Steroidobacteraceae bacterium]
MTPPRHPSLLTRIAAQEDLNFLLTNRIPRGLLTRVVGRLSKVENPLIRDVSIGLWRAFADLDLADARTTQFRSMHDCFTRQLRDGARPIDPDDRHLTSPCDGIVGAHGRIDGDTLLQAKGSSYALPELLANDTALAQTFHDGQYLTLRLTSGMYHRFHAPHDCRVEQVNYISGEAYNVNPAALKRIEKLFCRNERAVLRCRLTASGQTIALVPVAAVLVASIRLHCLDVRLHLKYRGPNVIACDAPFHKGQEMGWFEHGSTIIVLAPQGFALCDGLREGARIRMGQPILTSH